MRMRSLASVAVSGLLLGACAATIPRDARVVPAGVPPYEEAAERGALFDTVAALDAALFDSFNRCDDPVQRQEHAALLDAALEFYHDKGGPTWGRDKYMADVAANVCGKFARRLVPGTLRVYPVEGFGAIELGVHMFCPFASARCEGAGDFLILWRQEGDAWRVTRTFSYAHRAM
jgi:hypothetical protein